MLCLEDYLDALDWAQSMGGIEALQARADANAQVLFDWIDRTPWIANLAQDPATRSNTSVCLRIADPAVAELGADQQWVFAKQIAALLEEENAAYDIAAHRDAPPGLRVWTGSTVEQSDLEALTPWLDWAFASARASLPKAA